jgi:hypothetical protein
MLKKIEGKSYHKRIILVIAFFSFWEVLYLLGLYNHPVGKGKNVGCYLYQPQKYSFILDSDWQIHLPILVKSLSKRQVFLLKKTIKIDNQKKGILKSRNFLYPFKIPLKAKFYLSSPYGYRYHPILKRRMYSTDHGVVMLIYLMVKSS